MDGLQLQDDYFWSMAARSRLITILYGGSVAALCTFFLLQSEQEIPRFYHRGTWTTPIDTNSGTTVYIDKILSYIPLTREIARLIEMKVTELAPSWQTAVWYRPSHGDLPDRRYTYRRRDQNAYTYQV